MMFCGDDRTSQSYTLTSHFVNVVLFCDKFAFFLPPFSPTSLKKIKTEFTFNEIFTGGVKVASKLDLNLAATDEGNEGKRQGMSG